MTTFGPLFIPQALLEAVSDEAWLRAMLRVEHALALASGVEVDDTAFDASLYDVVRLSEQGRRVGNPAEPLVRALRERAGAAVHRGATSQDVVDTAAMLVAREARAAILEELDGASRECARLAETHRSTSMAARTLLQQAVPTTFGYTAARWLVALLDARERLASVRLAAQLGGAAGTLAAFDGRGLEIRARFCDELNLEEPLVPWHTDRSRIAELAAALAAVATACSRIGLDVVLLAQTEVGEVRERSGGGSSTLPHKHNPVRAVLARACARVVNAQASLLIGGEHEHERAAGAWQAEWGALSDALAYAGGAAAAARECLAALEVDSERMIANMSDELYAEARSFGIDGPYLGVAEELTDGVLARWRG